MSSAGPAVSQEDVYRLELESLMNEDQATDEYVQTSNKTRKRKRLSIVEARAGVKLETSYKTRDIRTYCPDPAAFGKDEKLLAHEHWTRLFVVCKIPLSIFDHPLFAVCKSLETII